MERADARGLRLASTEGLTGKLWRVEVEHKAGSALRIGAAPMTLAEAEWLMALLVARWPELAERLEGV